MKRIVPGALALAILPTGLGFAAARGPSPIRRFALVVGANRGAADRVPLRYAVSDAERFADVVSRMGGVAPADRLVLRDPTRQAFLDALRSTSERAGQARAETARVEVILYFSGHADDQGLMLGREMMPYRELRSAVGAIGADVGITILDACASGAITRLKGGQSHPAFLSDASHVVQGYAFLTSSSENEAAQESERLRGSFFTHALLTGMRGAADVSGDGRVTLSEAYQFAFHETLVQTTATQGGAQHPTYDIKMAGTGDVVMTDVRQNTTSLILGADYDGRFFVLNAQRSLVAELYKPFGRRVELGLEPGEYEVYFEQEKRLMSSSVKLGEGQHQELNRDGLRQTRRHPTRRRGGEEPDLLDKRFRVQVTSGVTSDLLFTHWLTPAFALDLNFANTWESDGLSAVVAGTRYYPPLRGKVRPYGSAGIGYFEDFLTNGERVGLVVGAGVDFYLGRRFSISLDSRRSLVPGNYAQTFGGLGFAWTFGGRH
jgi:hypothetical protein